MQLPMPTNQVSHLEMFLLSIRKKTDSKQNTQEKQTYSWLTTCSNTETIVLGANKIGLVSMASVGAAFSQATATQVVDTVREVEHYKVLI